MARGSYIKDLQKIAKARNQVILKAQEEINNLKTYLLSDKFREDTTVQTSDVLHRLEEIKQSMDNVEFEGLTGAYVTVASFSVASL